MKLTYFDVAAGRGEEVRIALDLAGLAFEDERVPHGALAEIKPKLPFGSLPVVEMPGRGAFVQTNALLRLIARLGGLYPDDPYEAARHDAVMDATEDFRTRLGVTLYIDDPDAKMATRAWFAGSYLPHWLRGIEQIVGDGDFVSGDAPGAADAKVYIIHRWISGGGVDGIAADTFEGCPRFSGIAARMGAHPVTRARGH